MEIGNEKNFKTSSHTQDTECYYANGKQHHLLQYVLSLSRHHEMGKFDITTFSYEDDDANKGNQC